MEKEQHTTNREFAAVVFVETVAGFPGKFARMDLKIYFTIVVQEHLDI